jgi:hypothetical protein
MVGYLSKKPKLSSVDDPRKFYRQRRHATQAKGLETLDPKAKVEGPSESPRESPHPSPKEDQPQPPPMGEQHQLERKIELCTPDVVDLPIINLQDTERPFKIKASTICMTIAGALEHFNEYIRAEFLEWHIGFLIWRMEKMEIEKEVLTPKFGTGRSLICGPSLVKRSVREKEGLSRKIRQRSSRSAVGFRSARKLFALILRDCVMTWPERKGRMDG